MEPESTLAGRTLLHYRVLAKIGEGGMGVVYHARDTRLDRDVVLKVLAPGRSTPQDQRRFLGEAKAASALNHPNIVTIYEIASADNLEFIAMERVEGATLQQLIGEHGLPLHDALDYAVQIADALAKAHAAGIVHRDIKPGNIMVTPHGLVKVLDFGLAKRTLAPGGDESTARKEDLETLTQAGMIVGTPSYMSPEQISGEPVDFRSDIFAFGVVLYEMLTGLRPFKGGSAVGIARSIMDVEPPSASSVRAGLPDALDAVLARALAKKPQNRYASTAHLASELKLIASQLASANESAATVSMSRGFQHLTPRRTKLWVAGGLALAIGTAVVAIPAVRSRLTHTAAVASGTPLSLYRQGRAYVDRYDQQGNVDRAIEVFTRAVKLDPQNASEYAGLADAYLAKFDAEKDDQWLKLARDSADKALRLQPDLAAAHVSSGSVLARTGSHEEAMSELRQGLELDPKSAPAYLQLASLQQTQSQWTDAEASYRKAIATGPSGWRNYLGLGVFLYGRGRFEEAAKALEKGRELSPDNVVVLRIVGAAYHALNRDDDAASAFQRALEIRPSAMLYNNLGTLQFFHGHYQDAVQTFERALALDATSSIRWGNLADAYRWTPENKDKAQSTYLHAIQLARDQLQRQPGDSDTRGRLALYLAKSGDSRAALQEVQRLETQHSPTPSTLYRSAVVYEIAGDRQKALAELELALAHGYALNEVANEPEFAELRRDRRYQELVMRFTAAAAPRQDLRPSPGR